MLGRKSRAVLGSATGNQRNLLCNGTAAAANEPRTSATSSATPPGTSSRQHLREQTSLRHSERSTGLRGWWGHSGAQGGIQHVSTAWLHSAVHASGASPSHATAALAGRCTGREWLPPPLLPPTRHPAGPHGIRLCSAGAGRAAVPWRMPLRRAEPSGGACQWLGLGSRQPQGTQGAHRPQHRPPG